MLKVAKKAGIVVFIILALINIYPFVFSLLSSFKGSLELFSSFMSLPETLKWENYVTAWNEGNIGRYFFNTIILAAFTLIITAFVGALASYVLSKFQFKLKGMMYLFFVAGMMIPIQAVIIPLAYIFGKLGIMNNYPMLIMLFTAFSIPITILILTGYISSIPTEIEESAFIDGASIFQIFLKLILPLAKPAIFSVSIFNFIQVWNNLLFPLIFISERNLGTIATGLLQFFGERSNDYGAALAGISLTTIPVIILYIFFQSKIEDGLISGSVKG
ncbi:carbohydrate ABC transporter permease [Gracilibacillus phocaeensis]|uniref:carbohydrate ABC transporter permease n=1 Tax=Gracilibacillus phocaeensis TaxID=2042304 RepID=UPI0010326FAB|nr:carbohydrate ABC transporter permease [Gracilibacillus phocaeensis]